MKRFKKVTKNLIKTTIEANHTEAETNIKTIDKDKNSIHKEDPITDKINSKGQEVKVIKKIDKIMTIVIEMVSINLEPIKINIDQKELGKIGMVLKEKEEVTEITSTIKIDKMV